MPDNIKPQETDWIEITKAFKYPQGEITEAHLESMAKNYKFSADNMDNNAPAIMGHTRDDDDEKPAMAWVYELKKEGKSLWARFIDYSGEFISMLKNKALPKRSIECYTKKGNAELRAVAFMSAGVPAAKGMSYQFAEELRLSNTEYNVFSFNHEEEINMEDILKLQEVHKTELAKLAEAHNAEVKRLNEAITTKDTAYAELKQTADAAVLKLSEIEKAKRRSDIESRIKALSTKEKPKVSPGELTELIALAESLTDDQVNGFVKSIENRADLIAFGEQSEAGKEDEVKVNDADRYTRKDPRVIRLATEKKIDLTKLSVDEFNEFTRPIVADDMKRDKGKPVAEEEEQE